MKLNSKSSGLILSNYQLSIKIYFNEYPLNQEGFKNLLGLSKREFNRNNQRQIPKSLKTVYNTDKMKIVRET